MIDWLIKCPDLCWFYICEHLSLLDISRLSSTCRILRHMLWSDQALLWTYLIPRKFGSLVLSQLMPTLFKNDEDEDSIIAENDQFCERLASDITAYQGIYEKFLNLHCSRSWHSRLTSARKEMRGFFACQRFTYPNSIPLFNCSIPLSLKLFRLYYYRLKKNIISVPINAIVYAYLIDCRRCLSVGDMVYQDNTMPTDELRPVKVNNDGGVCITHPCQSSASSRMIYLRFDKIPLLIDLLPGRYNLTCQMRLQRHCVDHDYSEGILPAMAPVKICLMGDRADRCGQRNFLRYPWLKNKHNEHGDDRWFDVSLIENFLVKDLSNVYFGIHVENLPILYDIWIKTLQLNFNAIN